MLISNKSDYNKFKRLYDSLSPQDKYLYHINDPAVDNPQLYRRITDKGAIILSPYKGKINKATVSVVVDPTARGLGVGTQLGKDAIRWSSINKVKKLYWDYLPENEASYQLSQKLGFTSRPKKVGEVNRVKLKVPKFRGFSLSEVSRCLLKHLIS